MRGQGPIARLCTLTPSRSGVVVSLFTGGAFIGAGLAGPAGDYLGRRWTILLVGLSS